MRRGGDHITNTKAYKNAGTHAEKNSVMDKAQQLTAAHIKQHVEDHGYVHTCVKFFSFSFRDDFTHDDSPPYLI